MTSTKEKSRKNGLTLIFTGYGKGKTTAALGMTLRAVGHGFKICFIQFIKGSWKYGEMESLARFSDQVDFHVIGRGFTWKSDDLEKDRYVAQKAWKKAHEAIFSGKYELVVLDEFTYLLKYDMIDRNDALKTLRNKPRTLHLVITGRDADPALLEMADLITEMKVVRHPYSQGVKAQRGIEF